MQSAVNSAVITLVVMVHANAASMIDFQLSYFLNICHAMCGKTAVITLGSYGTC